MYKRKSSGLGGSEDGLEQHSARKVFKSVGALEDSDDNDEDDYEKDDKDEDNESEDNESNLRNQSGKNDYSNFISQDKSKTEKEQGSNKGIKSFGYDYMRKHGYKVGSGLGKWENGIIEPVEASKQKGKRGFGFQTVGLRKGDLKYDPKLDEIFIEEKLWLANDHPESIDAEILESWVRCGSPITELSEDSPFCEADIIRDIIQSKNDLDNFTDREKKNGRRRSNPFESIHNAIFLNRAAMKMANMDAILDRMFTEPKTKTGENVVGPNELLYFADVCAGPGGFSEYVLYRKKWRAKGFGFTLKSENDFKLDQFIAGPSETFEPYYGVKQDGDVFAGENITSFKNHVMKYTDNRGVHFMMADGGIPIEKDLCEQEIKCKKLYLCQCIVALLIVRPGGHFVVKLFDLFTEFSVGLVYLIYRSFEEILILKPNTSRPANSERYLICKFKRKDCGQIAEHLFKINEKVPRPDENPKEDVLELVPTDVLENDEKFINYIRSTNKTLGKRQINSLLKLAEYSEKTELTDDRQQRLRKEYLKLWDIPDEARAEPKKLEPRLKWKELVPRGSLYESDFCSGKKVTSKQFLDKIGNKIYSWNAVVLCEEESNSTCGFYLGLGRNNVHRYSGGKWAKLNSIQLCLPANTIVYGEIVPEFLGSGKSQTKNQAFHIIDGLVLGGEDIWHLSFQKRGEMCDLFAKALLKETCPVRLKTRFLLGEIDRLWQQDHLVLKQTKSSRRPCLAISLGEENKFYKAAGVMFVKDMRDPWNRYKSKNWKQFFVDNGKRNEFEDKIQDNKDQCRLVYADFEKCFQSRLIWWWDEGVIVHEDQKSSPNPGKMQRKDVMNLIAQVNSN